MLIIVIQSKNRDGEPFWRRVPKFRSLESRNIWRAKTKNIEFWANSRYTDNIILGTETPFHFFLMWDSNQKCSLKSYRGVTDAMQSAIWDLGVGY